MIPSSTGNTIELPPQLPRPEYDLQSPSRVTLDAIAPDLVQIPLPFIQEQISLRLGQMLAGLRDTHVPTTISGPRAHSITVPIPRDTGHSTPMYPTHVLSVSLPSTGSIDAVLIPIHDIVFVAHCSAEILRPVSDIDVTPCSLVLSLCPVVRPSVQAAFLLRAYIYTHRAETLLNEILALPAPLTEATVDAALGNRPRPWFNPHPTRFRRPHCSPTRLRPSYPRLWSVLDLAWELALRALKFVAEVQSRQIAAGA